MCVCVCVCVCDRERECKLESDQLLCGKREREKDLKSSQISSCPMDGVVETQTRRRIHKTQRKNVYLKSSQISACSLDPEELKPRQGIYIYIFISKIESDEGLSVFCQLSFDFVVSQSAAH